MLAHSRTNLGAMLSKSNSQTLLSAQRGYQTKSLRFVLHRMSCSEHELRRIKSIHCYGRDSFEASQPAAAGIARPSAFAVEAASWLQLNIMRLPTAGERGGTHKLSTWLMRFPKKLELSDTKSQALQASLKNCDSLPPSENPKHPEDHLTGFGLVRTAAARSSSLLWAYLQGA